MRRSVRKAVEFLLRVAQPNGLIATPAEEGRSLHGHGFAMLFLAQVYGMEDDRATRRRLHDVLARAVRITERSQSRAGGWLYSPNSDGDEGSVTVTQIQGLRACRDARGPGPRHTVKNAVRYIERSANPDGGIRYNIHRRRIAPAHHRGRRRHPLQRRGLRQPARATALSSTATARSR